MDDVDDGETAVKGEVKMRRVHLTPLTQHYEILYFEWFISNRNGPISSGVLQYEKSTVKVAIHC